MHLVHRDFFARRLPTRPPCPDPCLASPQAAEKMRVCASRVPDYVKIRRRNIHSIHGRGPEIVSTP
jgi:hypothetical protein